jgi:hypothetical protein
MKGLFSDEIAIRLTSYQPGMSRYHAFSLAGLSGGTLPNLLGTDEYVITQIPQNLHRTHRKLDL